jgi:hypothetical protein
MLRLCSKISITNEEKEVFTLDYVKNIEATTSWDTMVDTAKVVLPKNVYVVKDNTVQLVSLKERTIAGIDFTGKAEKANKPLFTVGNKIKIEIGYDFNYNVIMEGLITEISPTVPIVLSCADPMWLLKRIQIKQTIKSPTLEGLLKVLTQEFSGSDDVIKFDPAWYDKLSNENKLSKIELIKDTATDNFTLTNISIEGKTIAAVLDELRDEYQVYSYYDLQTDSLGVIQSRTIVCGNYYKEGADKNTLTLKKFNFQNNVISDELVHKKEDDVKLNVVATDIKEKSKPSANISSIVGTGDDKPLQIPTGNKTIYLNFFKIGDGDTTGILKGIAGRLLKTLRYNGYSGHFTTFGKPFVKHGDTVELIDDYVKDRTGKIKVRQVDYSFGDGGFKQKIHLHMIDLTPPEPASVPALSAINSVVNQIV